MSNLEVALTKQHETAYVEVLSNCVICVSGSRRRDVSKSTLDLALKTTASLSEPETSRRDHRITLSKIENLRKMEAASLFVFPVAIVFEALL
jgi:hypothetical protein